MLILFIYITRIASNEKFKFNFNLIIIFTLLTLLIINPNIINFLIQLSMVNQEIIKLNNHWILNLSINKIFNYPSRILLIFLIIYLFITLIAVVKITESKIGPLRQKN